MKKITILALIIISTVFAQDITNKLGASGNYNVTDSSDNVLFQVRGDGRGGMGGVHSSALFYIHNQSVWDQFSLVVIGEADNMASIRSDALGENSSGVYGTSNSKTGSGAGVFGYSNAPTGAGVYGLGDYVGGHFKSTAQPYSIGLIAEGTSAAAYFVGEVLVNGPVTVQNFLNLESASIDIDDGVTITPTKSYMRVYPLTNVTLNSTTAIADGVTVGQFLFIQNVNSSYTITIPASANVNGVSPITIGNYDTIQLLWDGANWAHINN